MYPRLGKAEQAARGIPADLRTHAPIAYASHLRALATKGGNTP